MTTLVITGPSRPLRGHVALDGGKNAALPLLLLAAAADLTLDAVPTGLLDVQAALGLLVSVGATVDVLAPGRLRLRAARHGHADGPSIRSTPLLLTALLGQLGDASVPNPGGCAIGPRPIDEHVRVLRALGAEVGAAGDRLTAKAPRGLTGAPITLRHASTTATQVAILGAVLASGDSEIAGGNLRYENRCFIETLVRFGARITIDGERVLIAGGGLTGGHSCVPATGDEAVTWLAAGLVTGGAVSVGPIAPAAVSAEVALLELAGATVTRQGDRLTAVGPLRAFAVRAGPPPALGSDVQPIAAALAACAVGRSHLDDPRFPGRFAYADGLMAMGVAVQREGPTLAVTGGPRVGAVVDAPDLRGGMALLLAALGATGETRLHHFDRVERGYADVARRLTALGATVTLV